MDVRGIGVWLCMGIGLLLLGLAGAQAQPAGHPPILSGGEQKNAAKERQRRQDQILQQTFGPMEIRRDVVYAKVDGKDLTLDVFVPNGKAQAGELRPLVIWVHGGGWRQGDKDPCAALFLMKAGYAVASINYRLTGEASFPAQIWDCKAAVRFLRAKANEFGYDPGPIGMMGGSAGGHLAALMGTTNNNADLEGKVGDYTEVSSHVHAVCDWFGPTNLTVQYFEGKEFPKELVVPMSPEKVLNTEVNKSVPRNELTDLLGGLPTRTMEKAILASPILQVGKDAAPFLIMHGDQDQVVPIYQSRTFAQRLREEGVPVELVEIAGAGHGGGEFVNAERMGQIRAFFDRYLRKMKAEEGVEAKDGQGKGKGTLPKTFKTR